jgi:hypothetical protein
MQFQTLHNKIGPVTHVDSTSYRANHLNEMHWNSFSKSSARRSLLSYLVTHSLTHHSLTHSLIICSLTHHSLTHPHKLSSASRWYLSGLPDFPTFWSHNFQHGLQNNRQITRMWKAEFNPRPKLWVYSFSKLIIQYSTYTAYPGP